MFSISETEAAEEERGVNAIAAAPDEVSSFSLKKPTYQKYYKDKKVTVLHVFNTLYQLVRFIESRYAEQRERR